MESARLCGIISFVKHASFCFAEVFISQYSVVDCRIKELCYKRGYSLTQLAEMVGISKTQLSDYIALRNVPNVEMAYSIARCLDCPVEDLYNWRPLSGSNTEG
ncbi:helix-turn-helix domain-containing protein [Bacillus safensis]|uniref:helix-turn-helix domain-containing protein n=1 Tax=Bacillus safensis TaxID=561879 RepID=UPI003D81A55A